MPAFTRRQYAGAAAATTITAAINSTDTTCSLAATTGWPSTGSVPFYIVLDPGTSTEEKCSATISGSTLTLTRGQDDTSASSHSAGATVYPVFTANDADEANELVAKLTTKGDLLVTTGSALNRLAVGTNDFALLADSAATNGVKWGQITAAGLVSDAVTTAKILNANVTAAKLATDSVETAKIVNLNVTTAKIADLNVTTAKVADLNVTTAKIADLNVTTGKIADSAVTQAKMADRAVGSAELDNLTLNAQTGTTYTLVLTDAHKLVTLSNASAISLTVPTNASVAFDIGDQVNLLQLGAGQVTVGGAGVTLRSQGSKLKLNGQYSTATLVKIGTDEWVLLGNTAA
jgi:hypothetical protein